MIVFVRFLVVLCSNQNLVKTSVVVKTRGRVKEVYAVDSEDTMSWNLRSMTPKLSE